MSKRSRTLKNARGGPGKAVTKVRSPGDTLALVPYLLGFMPVESLVVISLVRGGKQFGPVVRLDLPDPEDRQVVADGIGRLARQHTFTKVVVAAFSADPTSADPFARMVIDRLGAQQVSVVDAFRGDGRRWWSYVCTDASCCSPGGCEYDADASAAAASAVLAGMTKATDREALRQQFEPGDEADREAVAAELAILRARAVAPMTSPQIDTLMPRVLAGELTGPRERAHLLLSLTSVAQRDHVWGQMDAGNAAEHFEGWRGLMRLAPDDLLAPVGSLTAFAAWLSGRGVLASHAVERVLELHPEYSMARLILRAVETSMSPREWRSWTG